MPMATESPTLLSIAGMVLKLRPLPTREKLSVIPNARASSFPENHRAV